MSFPSVYRITVLLLDKDTQSKPANKNPLGISGYRQQILNKSQDRTNWIDSIVNQSSFSLA